MLWFPWKKCYHLARPSAVTLMSFICLVSCKSNMTFQVACFWISRRSTNTKHWAVSLWQITNSYYAIIHYTVHCYILEHHYGLLIFFFHFGIKTFVFNEYIKWKYAILQISAIEFLSKRKVRILGSNKNWPN